MQSISSIQANQIAFNTHANYAALCGVVAGIIVLASVILIISGSLILTLKGVNAVRDVMLPVMVPAAGGIGISIPLFAIMSVRNSAAKPHEEAFFEGALAQIRAHEQDEEKLIIFIEEQILTKDYRGDYNYVQKFATYIMEKTEAKRDSPLAKALGEVQKRINPTYRNKKKEKP